MKPACDRDARNRPVNLTLNADLVSRAMGSADNLSGVVESLLAEYVAGSKASGSRNRRASR
jgi:hypothetical protein